MLDTANELARVYEGLLVERKHAAIALHYRLAPQLEAVCRDALLRAIDRQPQFELLHGKFVFEVKPAGINKGIAIDAFMREAPFAGRTPVFAGDDTTDESGFAVVQPRGGVAIKVGSGPSLALHRLDSPRAVFEWLVAGTRTAAPNRHPTPKENPHDEIPRGHDDGGRTAPEDRAGESIAGAASASDKPAAHPEAVDPAGRARRLRSAGRALAQPRRDRQLRLQRADRRARPHRLVLPAALRRRPGVQRAAATRARTASAWAIEIEDFARSEQ